MAIVPIKDCSLGWAPDVMPEELAPGSWSGCLNMRFRNGFAERFRGLKNIAGTLLTTPYFITAYAVGATRYLVYCGTNKICVTDGTTHWDITPSPAPTGGIDDRWTGGMFNGVMILNNGVDQPFQWGGNTASPATILSNWVSTWRAKSIRPFKEFLVAMNITISGVNYPHRVIWSNPAVPGSVPGSWDITNPANDAGDGDRAQTSDVLIDGLSLGDQFMIYKERTMYSMRYIGGQEIMAFQLIPGGEGLIAQGCAVDTPVGHFMLTNGDVVVHQGGPVQSVADGAVRRWLFNTMDSILYKRSFVCSNPQKNELLVCFPSVNTTVCDSAVVYNWKDKTWGFRNLQNATYGTTAQINADATLLQWDTDNDSWDSDASAWNENEYSAAEARLILVNTTNIVAFDIGTADFGQEMGSMLERTGWDVDSPETVKLIKAVYPRVDGPATTSMQITVGGALSPAADTSWSGPATFMVGSNTQIKADCFASGRYLALRIEGLGFEPWRLRRLGVDINGMGAY